MKSKKAFTLLELLVAMAIIAIILSLAIFGIIQVQRNSRETQRRKAAEDINIGIQDYFSNYGEYPAVLNWSRTAATLCDSIGCDSTQAVVVPLKTAAQYDANGTTTKFTKWSALSYNPRGYILAYCNERGQVVDAGTVNNSDGGSFSCP